MPERIDYDWVRTLAIITELGRGRRLYLPNCKRTLAMGEDYRIGFLVEFTGDMERVVDDISVSGLNALLNAEGISMPLPL